MSKSKISVVIPTYNNENTILATLNSLMQQTLAADEIIVIDDYSDTKVSSILEGHYPAVKVLRHQTNRGVQIARNTGVSHVTGEYVLFLDADDLLCPEYLSVASKLLDEEETLGACCGNFYRCFDENAAPIMESHVEIEPKITDLALDNGLSFYLTNTGAFLPSFTLFRKSALDDVCIEGHLFPPNVWGNEDFHLFVRILSKYTVFFIQNPIGIYFLRPESISRNQIKVWSSRTVALDSLLELAEKLPYSNQNLAKLKKMRSISARRCARLHYTSGIQKEAMSGLWTEFKRSPSIRTLGLLFIVVLRFPVEKKEFAGREY